MKLEPECLKDESRKGYKVKDFHPKGYNQTLRGCLTQFPFRKGDPKGFLANRVECWQWRLTREDDG